MKKYVKDYSMRYKKKGKRGEYAWLTTTELGATASTEDEEWSTTAKGRDDDIDLLTIHELEAMKHHDGGGKRQGPRSGHGRCVWRQRAMIRWNWEGGSESVEEMKKKWGESQSLTNAFGENLIPSGHWIWKTKSSTWTKENRFQSVRFGVLPEPIIFSFSGLVRLGFAGFTQSAYTPNLTLNHSTQLVKKTLKQWVKVLYSITNHFIPFISKHH